MQNSDNADKQNNTKIARSISKSYAIPDYLEVNDKIISELKKPLEYYSDNNTWFSYCIGGTDPHNIKNIIQERYIALKFNHSDISGNRGNPSNLKIKDLQFIHLDIYNPSLEKDDAHGENTKTKSSNIRIEYDPNLPIILFIHGTAVYSRFYAEFLYKLARQGFNVVAMDMPGHGLSSGSRGDFTLMKLVSSVRGVISFIMDTFLSKKSPGPENNKNNNKKVATIPKIILLGSSLGGIMAFYTSSIENDRISASICMNAAL
ncbi:MAG: alpha/beta hydrolase [Promethearchaeota archaeon]